MEEQRRIRIANNARLLKRSCESLLGICTGLMADGRLDDSEITFLSTWLEDNEELSRCWPGEVVYARVRDVLEDGVITEDERKYLEQTLSELIGGTLQETGIAFGGATTLPVEDADIGEIGFEGRMFCFTGKFLYGTRSACQRAVAEVGGLASDNVRVNLDYLVIGTLASREWANTSHGRKIEKAMNYKQKGREIAIVSEARWFECLQGGLA